MTTIGELARGSGVNLETIRYYERIGLMPEPARTSGGHRDYEDQHGQRLSFIRRSRELGFTLDQIRELLDLSQNDAFSCASVTELAESHLQEVRRKIADLTRLEVILADAVSCCGSAMTVAECPVLAMLSE